MTSWIAAQSQPQMEVPGDNFSLEGALELFKKSSTPEDFERMLNSPDSRVNNLDLNGDGYIDYIRVIDILDGNVHAFVLQAVISRGENQDIAVITLEKLANGKAILQITGDEDIYGIETIIEPTREVQMYAGTTSSAVYINVWSWPMVRYVYGPRYSVWISPWGWSYRPHWWHTWRPVVYYDYYTYWSPYGRFYSTCYTTRIVHAHHIYRPYRTTSVIVHNRHSRRVAHYRSTYIDRDGRYGNNNIRNSRVQQNNSVRYNANGRIISDNRVNSRTSSNNSRTQQSNVQDRQRSSAVQGNRSAYTNSSENVQRTTTNRNAQRTTDRSVGSSNNQKSSINSGQYRNSGSTNVQRSTTNSGNRSAAGSTTLQRPAEKSSGNGNAQRSSSNIQRSSQRSSGNASNQRSAGSSNVQKSTGNSSVQRSSGSSSRSANVQSSNSRSSGNSDARRSSSNSGNQRSSGSTNTRR